MLTAQISSNTSTSDAMLQAFILASIAQRDTVPLLDLESDASKETHPLGRDSLTQVRQRSQLTSTMRAMLAAEEVLRRDWDSPEEDEAWADL